VSKQTGAKSYASEREKLINKIKEEHPKTHVLLKEAGLWELFVDRLSRDLKEKLEMEALREGFEEDLQSAVTAIVEHCEALDRRHEFTRALDVEAKGLKEDLKADVKKRMEG